MQGKEAERKRIAGEMHDDIGSSLTTIMYLSNNLNSNDEQLKNKTINKITTTAGFVVDKMNEIIWSMNKEYDTLEDLITYIRYNTVQLLENFNMNYKFKIPSEIPSISLSGEKRRNIYLVVKEAVHNIIKHAEATEAEIEFIIDGNIKINIIDNGKGFDETEHSKFGNGLKNMKSRMETIGGRFSIFCNGKTNITISLPLYDLSIKPD